MKIRYFVNKVSRRKRRRATLGRIQTSDATRREWFVGAAGAAIGGTALVAEAALHQASAVAQSLQYVDLTSNQSVGGTKTFTSAPVVPPGTFALPADVAAEAAARTLADTLRIASDQTADYTLVIGDAGKVVRLNSATPKTVTVPPNASVAFPIGTLVEINQVGAGSVSLVGGTGVTLYNAASTPAQSGSLVLRQQSLNVWDVYVGLVTMGTWISGSGAQPVTGVKTFVDPWEVNDGVFGNSRAFRMRTRDAVPTTPVPCIRPSATDKIIGVDVCPNGSPVAPGTAADIAWIDVCDADVQTGAPPVTTARIGARGDYIEFGSRSFDGGTVKPVYFTVGGKPTLKLQTDGNIEVQQDRNAVTAFRLKNLAVGPGAYAEVGVRADVATGTLRTYSSGLAYDSGAYANMTDVANDAAGVLLTAGGFAGQIVFRTGGLVASNKRMTITSTGLVQVANNLEAKRFAGRGTPMVVGDFILHANWGVGAGLMDIAATDQGGTFSVATGSSALAANPTVTITFKEPYPISPNAVVVRNGGTSGTVLPTWTTSASQLVITFPDIPPANGKIGFSFLIL